MGAPRLSLTERHAVLNDYLHTALSVYAIAAKHGVHHTYPIKLAVRYGYRTRDPKRGDHKRDKAARYG